MRARLAAALLSLAACKFPPPPDVPDDADPPDVDAPAAVAGGVTAAQLTWSGQAHLMTFVPAPDGGVIAGFVHQHTGPAVIAGTTVPCGTCAIVVKLDASLSHVDWFAHSGTMNFRDVRLTTSPDGRLYWGLEAEGFDTYDLSFDGNHFAQPLTIRVPGAEIEGNTTGGARVVIALTPAGEVRWSHSLAQTTLAAGNFLGPFGAFAAADGSVLSTFVAKGTLGYRDGSGTGSRSVPSASVVIHELDPENGLTRQLAVSPTGTEHTSYGPGVGLPGFADRGFVLRTDDVTANGTVLRSGFRVAALGTGGPTGGLVYALGAPSGEPNTFAPHRLRTKFAASALVNTSVTLETTVISARSVGGDAVFAVLDNASTTVLAHAVLGGSGSDRPTHLVGVDDANLFGVGSYQSSDMAVGDQVLPPPLGAQSAGIFAAFMRREGAELTPVWARGLRGSGVLDAGAATADAVTGDLYLGGRLAAGATADFGLGPVTGEVGVGSPFLLRITRGEL